MASMFKTLLIANRGEIAVRIARTARRMGIETIAVFSEADATALHVRVADRAVPIGPSAARDSYLNVDRILAAASATGAEAIHPGYGFLSENAEFADACAAAGLSFVGPPASAMRAMGSKAAAKSLMAQSSVPLLPGYHGDDQDAAFLADQAARIGFPVVIKAVSGGGGRGMRVVTDATEFTTALASARQEAASSFGDDRVLIERYLDRPRHIEVQVFADTHGNAVHLFERDCSTQRRHQKVIEEAPAPGLSPDRRAEMGAAAVAAAQAVGYVGAGTVEFVADSDGFFFLEMNTRLQVEHPVTEMITGLDLVEWQLRVAAGETLPLAQHDIPLQGHAIEVRVYAEDPVRDFAPSIGQLAAFRLPADTPTIRVDTGFVTGDTVTAFYDAMLAKLICHGPSREAALRELQRALDACVVAGVTTNLDLLGRLVAAPAFQTGAVDTGFIARESATLLAPPPPPPPEVLAVATLAELTDEAEAATREAAMSQDPYSPWNARDQWWTNATPEREMPFQMGEASYPVYVRRSGDGWRLRIGDGVIQGRAQRAAADDMTVTLDGAIGRYTVIKVGDTLTMRHRGDTFRLRLPDPIASADEAGDVSDRLLAPIPGLVTEMRATPGQTVARGDVLVILEAMKTVFRLAATGDRVVAEIGCAAGDTVQEGQILVRFATDEA
jgi:3-methylcrotonyl-CoA carboxylase alpha subunit